MVTWGGFGVRLERAFSMALGDHYGGRTFVFEEIAHAGPTRQHELRDVFDDLGLVFRGEGGEPFRQSLGLDAS